MVFPGPKFIQLGPTELGLSRAEVREWQQGSARAGKSLHAAGTGDKAGSELTKKIV